MEESKIELVDEKNYWAEFKDYPGKYFIVAFDNSFGRKFFRIGDDEWFGDNEITILARIEDYKQEEK